MGSGIGVDVAVGRGVLVGAAVLVGSGVKVATTMLLFAPSANVLGVAVGGALLAGVARSTAQQNR